MFETSPAARTLTAAFAFAAGAPIAGMDGDDAAHDVGGELCVASDAPAIVEYRHDRAIADAARQWHRPG